MCPPLPQLVGTKRGQGGDVPGSRVDVTTDALTVRIPDALVLAGQAANDAAARVVFTDYRERKAANTIRRQDAGLALCADSLAAVEIEAGSGRIVSLARRR